MSPSAWAAVFVVLAWWLGTGVVLMADGLPRTTFRLSVGVASVLGLLGLWGLHQTSHLQTTAGAYVAFLCAMAVWAWHELTFLMGLVSGSSKASCPPDARGWRRFVLATRAVLHHEVALAATVLLVLVITAGGDNVVGAGTFLLLWVMRLSAKFNVYLGVRNLNVQFIPAHLKYLTTFFRKATLNPLMPLSIAGSAWLAWALWCLAKEPGATPHAQVGAALLAALAGLAMLEHVFLTLPVPDAWLWKWAMRLRSKAG